MRAALVDLLGGAVADHRQHRVDRHDAADEEGDGEQAEEGQQHHDDEAADAHDGARRARRCGAAGRQRDVRLEGHAADPVALGAASAKKPAPARGFPLENTEPFA